jgi:hypothetical protein
VAAEVTGQWHGEPSDSRLLHADGLHIHRWFLSVQPYLDARERRLTEQALAAGPSDRATQQLTRLRAILPQAAIEHILDPAQPDPLLDLPEPGSSSSCPAITDLCGQRVAVVDHSACRAVSNGVIIAASSLAGQATAATLSKLSDASALLAATDLAYVVQLGLQVIVVAPGGHGAAVRRFAIARTGEIAEPATVIDVAQELLRAAAPTWVSLFLEVGAARQRELHAAAASDAPQTSQLSSRAVAEAIAFYQAAVVYRFLLAALSLGPQPSDRALCRDRLRAINAEIARIGTRVYEVADSLQEPMTSDLLRISFPGPHQFDKYRDGAIAGQG